jgi:hypothetical protein
MVTSLLGKDQGSITEAALVSFTNDGVERLQESRHRVLACDVPRHDQAHAFDGIR